MKSTPSQITPEQAFYNASYIVFLLGFVSVGTSNIISALFTKSLDGVDLVSAVLIPVYFLTGFFIKRKSQNALLIAVIACLIQGVTGILQIFRNEFYLIGIGSAILFLLMWLFLYGNYRIVKIQQIQYSSGEQQIKQMRKRPF